MRRITSKEITIEGRAHLLRTAQEYAASASRAGSLGPPMWTTLSWKELATKLAVQVSLDPDGSDFVRWRKSVTLQGAMKWANLCATRTCEECNADASTGLELDTINSSEYGPSFFCDACIRAAYRLLEPSESSK